MKRASSGNEVLMLGGPPSAHLLPREVAATQKAQALRRLLVIGLVAVVGLVIVGIGASSFGVFIANGNLQAEQSRTAGLLAEQAKLGKVVTVQSQVSDIKGAQTIAATGEIMWNPYASALQASLPLGTSISSFTLRLDNTSVVKTTTDPLQGSHIATFTISANSPQASISDWLSNLAKIKGFVDASPDSVQIDETTGTYKVQVTMHLDQDAFANRFVEGTK